MTACDDYVFVSAQCAHALLHCCHRCFCASVYPRSYCHVNLTHQLLWSHWLWEMVPTHGKVYSNTRSSHVWRAIEIFTDIASNVSWIMGRSSLQRTCFASGEPDIASDVSWIMGVLPCSEPVSLPGEPLEHFSVSLLKLQVVTKRFSSWQKNSENLIFVKILKFSFSEFRKNRFDNFSKSI